MEGIVGKRKYDPYLRDQASWLKIRNTNYSKWVGREEIFTVSWKVIPISHYGTTASDRVPR